MFLRNTLLPRLPVTVLPGHVGLPCEPVEFQATDGVDLSGWKIASDSRRPWIILCHGLGANRADLLDLASGLFQAGYNLFLFDFRAHGTSQGRATSFGWQEQRDVEGALAFLGSQPDVADRPYGILGVSMGGVVAILVAAHDERLAAVVADSPYDTLPNSIARHLHLMHRLPKQPFLLFAESAYALRFGVWPSAVSPADAIGHISPRPVLLLHGDFDVRVPPADVQRLLERAQEPKELVVIQGAGHLQTFAADPGRYLARVTQFFDAQLK